MVTYALGDSLKPRGAPRCKTFQRITIGSADGETRAHILDLSQSGARIHTGAQLDVGATLILSAEMIRIKGRIVWTQDQVFGVRFDNLISETDLGRLAG